MTPQTEITLEEPAAVIEETSITKFIENQNLGYVLYTIGDRAIPSAIDGLKPGQRRVLYQMHVDKIGPDSKPRKSSKVASSTTGALHPHGHSAMYGTMVGLAAPYRRVRLIDGIGSFGQSPGDQPAADRYTEVRLSTPGNELVRELADRSVPMVPSYDSETIEPVHLPVRFPPLLIGGAQGMAEGYATLVPAHNPREVMALCRALLADPDMSTPDMREVMPGPDWGTGGIIVGDDSGIDSYYDTGRGKMRVRCSYLIEGKDVIITEIPPGVGVPRLLSTIRDKATEGLIPGISDVSDLTDLDNGLRIVVTAKRGTNPEELAQTLLSETDLETTFAASVVALDRGKVPKWWTVRELIAEFLSLRDEVILARSQHRLEKVGEALVRARAVAAVALDKEKASRIILDSEDKTVAASEIASAFELSEDQGEYVVGLPLYRLTKADALAAIKRVDELNAEAEDLADIIGSADRRATIIDAELAETEKLFAGDEYNRRTYIAPEIAPVGGVAGDEDAGAIADLSRWKFDTDTAVLGDSGTNLVDGNTLWAAFSGGKVKTFTGKGLPKRLAVTPIAPDVSDVLACGILAPDAGKSLLFITSAGKALRVDPDAINPQGIAGTGVAGIKLAEDDSLVTVLAVDDDDALLTVSADAYKVTAVSDIPTKGRGTGGVGVHILRGSDTGIWTAEVGGGFSVNGKTVSPALRAKATTKTPASNWEVV